jgi:hypothetical protein
MTDDFTIKIIDDGEVNPQLDAELRGLLSGCFTKDPVFRTRRFWKEMPSRRAILRNAPGDLGGHVAVHRKVLGSMAGDLLVGGIADVCVRADCRGRGYVRAMLAKVHDDLAAGKFDFAMLFGDKAVYSSSGYVNIDNPLRFLEGDEVVVKAFDYAMIRPVRLHDWPAGEIDLRGPIF